MEIVFLEGEKARVFTRNSETILKIEEINSFLKNDCFLLIKEYEVIGNKANIWKLPVILFYENYLICDENGICPLTNSIDNFIYATKASIAGKDYFNNVSPSQKISSNRKYVHAIVSGTVLVEDILIDGRPLKLEDNPIPIDQIGKEKIEKSTNFKILLKTGKIEIIDEKKASDLKNIPKKPIRSPTTLKVGSVDDFGDEEDKNDKDYIKINIYSEKNQNGQ